MLSCVCLCLSLAQAWGLIDGAWRCGNVACSPPFANTSWGAHQLPDDRWLPRNVSKDECSWFTWVRGPASFEDRFEHGGGQDEGVQVDRGGEQGGRRGGGRSSRQPFPFGEAQTEYVGNIIFYLIGGEPLHARTNTQAARKHHN